MICQKCGRVVRPGNTYGRNETCTERRYYCSCGFVNKTYETVVITWKKTQYAPRETPPVPVPAVEAVAQEPAKEDAPATPKPAKKRGRHRRSAIKE
jgi:hypothetical protein